MPCMFFYDVKNIDLLFYNHNAKSKVDLHHTFYFDQSLCF